MSKQIKIKGEKDVVESNNYIASVPEDVLLYVFSLLDVKDLGRISRTNRFFAEFVHTRSNRVWEKLYNTWSKIALNEQVVLKKWFIDYSSSGESFQVVR